VWRSFVKFKPIRTEKGYGKAVKRIGEIWGAPPGTPEANELKALRTLIEDYEQIHYRLYPPDPMEAIRIRMNELNLSWNDLVSCIGSKERVSDVLDRKCPLTLPMIQKLSEKLRISERTLRAPYPLNPPDGRQRRRAVG
jgi:HTH-type transcriptional regulator / antitoxin HigA